MASKIVEKAKSAMGVSSKHDIKLAGRKVHDTGYGLMGLTAFYGKPKPHEESFAVMKAALENGANFWNGGEIYGSPEANSLHLLNAYFTKYPEDADRVVISIKGGSKPGEMVPDGSPENVRRSIEECLRVLAGKKKLDIFESARVDPNVPIELGLREAKKFIESGQLGGVCLSECSADTIRRAAKIVKVEGVEVEFSLWETGILDNGVANTCAELDIPIIAYSPLGRGFLTGQIKSRDDLADDDFRKHMPRFQPEVFDNNLKLVEEIKKLADKKGCTAGQIGLAWVKAQGRKPDMPVVIPIPGSTSPTRVKENMVDVELSENDMKEIDSLLASAQIEGARYPGHTDMLNFGDSPELKE